MIFSYIFIVFLNKNNIQILITNNIYVCSTKIIKLNIKHLLLIRNENIFINELNVHNLVKCMKKNNHEILASIG